MPSNKKRTPAGVPVSASAITNRDEQENAHLDDTSVVGHFAQVTPTDPDQLAIEVDVEMAAHTLVDSVILPMRVLPVGQDKAPLIGHGFHAATTDHAEIARWWRRWPEANAAVAVPPGVLVIDIDLDKPVAAQTITDLESQFGPLPATRTVRTPKGGLHYYYAVPEDVRFRGIAGPGVDLRAGGRHYVLAPPSRIGTVRYEYLDSDEWTPAVDLPLSWVAGLEHQRPTLHTRAVPGSWIERLSGIKVEAVTIADLDAFLDALPAGPMDLAMAAAVDDRLTKRMRDAAHDALVRSVYRVIALGAEGHPGAAEAMPRVLRAFVEENERRLRHGLDGVRSGDELESEMLRAVFGAIAKVSAE